MPFDSALIGRVHVIRWRTAPERPDVKSLLSDLESSRIKAASKLINLSIVPEDVGSPSKEARDEMGRFRAAWATHCDVVHVAILGEGFRHTIARSVVAAFSLSLKRGLFVVHKSVEAACVRIAPDAGITAQALQRRLEALGFLSDPGQDHTKSTRAAPR